MLLCPCGSQLNYSICCEPYLSGAQSPLTPEALMRSRYTAYSLANIDYIQNTMRGKPLAGFNAEETKRWASSLTWTGLRVLSTSLKNPTQGYVEFIASFIEDGKSQWIHEISEFTHEQGKWFYVDGTHQKPSSLQSVTAQKIPRNAPCHCGSQKKFKLCHGKNI